MRTPKDKRMSKSESDEGIGGSSGKQVAGQLGSSRNEGESNPFKPWICQGAARGTLAAPTVARSNHGGIQAYGWSGRFGESSLPMSMIRNMLRQIRRMDKQWI
jgi:hypothetical protein